VLIERLELRNFEGYKYAIIDFTKGLNIITGRNSTGKTTLLEALLFALYGVAPGGEKKLLVSKLPGTTGNMAVRLSAKMAGKSVEILREGRLVGKGEEKRFRTERLSLKIDGKEVPINNEEELNKKIVELAGMGVKLFTTLVYARQGELTSILEPKKEDMDLVLGITLMKELVEQLDAAKKDLERYEGKDAKTMHDQLRQQEHLLAQQIGQLSEQASALAREVEALREVVEKAKSKEVAGLLQQISRRDSLLKGISEKEAAISSTLRERKAASVEELEKRLSELIDEEGKLRKRHAELQREESKVNSTWQKLNSRLLQIRANFESAGVATIKELEEKLTSVQAEYDQLVEERKAVEEEFDKAERLRSELSGKVSALKEEVEAHKELLAKGLANCPTCGQKVDPKVVRQIVEEKKRALQQLAVELEEVNARYSTLKRRINQLTTRASQLEANLTKLRGTREKVMALLEGVTMEQLEEKVIEAQKDLDGVRQAINNLTAELSKLKSDRESLQSAIVHVKSLEEGRRALEGELQKCLERIRSTLQALAFPFEPSDPELKAKIAERLPLSPEELAERERELKEKGKRLEKLRADVEDLKRREEEVRGKIVELQKRLERVKVCEDLLEKIRGGIESQRELRLRRIAEEALRIYETLTDQRIYKAFRINKDDYRVEVFPERLEGYIPAKRTGGGHQTLIALAVRIALLNVLNQRSLLILDEPTYGVDSENLPQLMSYFSEAAKKIGQTILVTHYGLGEEEAANIVKVSIAEDGSSVASQA
jgi:exonuclease SbcC